MEQLDLLPIELEGVSQERPLIIAGPCSAETEEQVMTTAKSLSDKGIKIFRAESETPYQTGRFRRYRCGRSFLAERSEEGNRYVRSHGSSYRQACVRMPES